MSRFFAALRTEPLLAAAAWWDDFDMSENEDQKLASPATGHYLPREKGIPAEEYEHPTTHQMRIIGQRRTEAEAKLERQQREARSKFHE
ncbi:hypothetical protein ABH924_002432 [Arthrobacter sp. GAS37]